MFVECWLCHRWMKLEEAMIVGQHLTCHRCGKMEMAREDARENR